MWAFIPAVDYSINSPKGVKRLEKHHVLFEFIDNYLGEMPFAFEPNMQDNRYVLLPDDVGHQGIGVTVSSEVPGFLEVGHFWYPFEFTEKTLHLTALSLAYKYTLGSGNLNSHKTHHIGHFSSQGCPHKRDISFELLPRDYRHNAFVTQW